MKQQRLLGALMSVAFILAACGNVDQAARGEARTSDQTQQDATRSKVVQPTTNQLSNDFYRALITDGAYQVSQTRGATLSLNTGFNLRNFEVGLIDISRAVFPTNQYFFREGQIIDEETAVQWVSRKSEKNPDGLNPESNQ